MLSLSRKEGQAIVIDGTTTVVVKKIEGNRVRLGVVAPRSINVRRAELTPYHEESDGATERRHPAGHHPASDTGPARCS